MNLSKNLENKIRTDIVLKSLTSFKIGGRAKYYIEPATQEELKKTLIFAKNKKLKIYCIGSGSNVLASDKGISGIIIKLNSKNFKSFKFEDDTLIAQSGCLLSTLLQRSRSRGLSGLEYFIGIPGTLGGALAMNAGIKEKNIGDLVEDVTILDYNGRTKILSKDEAGFSYRNSDLDDVIVLSATLKLKKSSKAGIDRVINDLITARKRSQDWSFPCAGCAFKNPANESAGRLIDLCGLKGIRVGDAQVSLKHANFIINRGNASSSDVLKLISIIKREVKKRFKIELTEEIKIWK